MKELRILHSADWHADNDPKKILKLEASLNQIVDYCRTTKVNAIVHSGDVWEKRQSHDNKSGVPLVYTKLRELSQLVDFIFIVKGNNSHDEPGSIKLLHQLESNIFAYEFPIVLGIDDTVGKIGPFGYIKEPLDLLRENPYCPNRFDYIVSLVPYPQKSGFMTGTSIDNNNADFLEKFEQLFELIGDVTQPYTCPKILAFHGNVVGSRLSTGQTLVSQDIMVAPSTLEKAQHDYYALGHIHLRQEIKPNMVYAGSIYNKSWGETEQKSFEVIEFVDVLNHPFENKYEYEMIQKRIWIESSRPMIKIDAEFDSINDFYFYDQSERSNYSLFTYDVKNAEYRLRIKVIENDRRLITEKKMYQLKDYFGEGVKIEFNVIPDERESRSEQIMNCRTLLDEVTEYAKVVEFELPESIKEKVLSLQESEVLL